MAYRLCIIIRIRDISVEEQILWVLSYVYRGSVNIKKEFRREDNKTMKMAELKKVEQKGKMIEELV